MPTYTTRPFSHVTSKIAIIPIDSLSYRIWLLHQVQRPPQFILPPTKIPTPIPYPPAPHLEAFPNPEPLFFLAPLATKVGLKAGVKAGAEKGAENVAKDGRRDVAKDAGEDRRGEEGGVEI